ncbi:MAG: bifunctional metallophosphatase/5'-nucleotidase [Muribaculaceae bacterium]|nr:bifunctional metallophosphatase/5'-nucleotidase [Muribaculaceae bacterium]
MDNYNFKKLLLPFLGAAAFCLAGSAEKLVILHTNDTHSSIEPFADGTSGILQRKAILDSVRKVEKNVITVDAGDVVQGSLYFKYFNGDVEYPLMNMSGYDIRILGNHEFDNGMESLANYYKKVEGEALSANYDFSGTTLDGIFKPFTIKEIDGRKIGFIGANIDPASIISTKNIDVNFKEVIPTINQWASYLKNEEKCDLVVVVSHIGYEKINDKTTDVELAQSSENIDLIIGGHTHTLIDPQHPEINSSLINNSKGQPVRVVQAGKYGKYIGKLTIDLDNLPLAGGEQIDYELIPVTNRFSPDQLDARMIEFIKPYQEAVDSVNNVIIAYCSQDLKKERTGGLPNLTADITFQYGREVVDSLRKEGIDLPNVDLSIMNVGGIRLDMPKGKITEGQILSTYPFTNLFMLISIKGKDIIEAMRVSALKGGEAISSNMRVITDKDGNLKKVIIDGKEMDPDKEYVVATIDYIAEGNDDLVSMANHKKLFVSDDEISVPILHWIKTQNALGLEIDPDMRPRFVIDIADVSTENN